MKVKPCAPNPAESPSNKYYPNVKLNVALTFAIRANYKKRMAHEIHQMGIPLIESALNIPQQELDAIFNNIVSTYPNLPQNEIKKVVYKFMK